MPNHREDMMRIATRIACMAAAAWLGLAVAATAAGAAEIVLVTTDAVKAILNGLVPEFERATGHTVKMSVYGTSLAVSKVKDGAELPDLVVLSPTALGELAKAGKVAGGTITDAFRSRVGLAVRSGAPKPDIGTADAFKATLLHAKSIGHSIGPSGDYFSTVLIQRLGIADALKSKLTVVRGRPVAAAVAAGDVEVGIHQIAELMQVGGIDIVGPAPAELQTVLIYATGLSPAGKQPEAAKALAKFLTSEGAAPVVRRNGMDPA
jgi:molybdate transport system substrate-binding protein